MKLPKNPHGFLDLPKNPHGFLDLPKKEIFRYKK